MVRLMMLCTVTRTRTYTRTHTRIRTRTRSCPGIMGPEPLQELLLGAPGLLSLLKNLHLQVQLLHVGHHQSGRALLSPAHP